MTNSSHAAASDLLDEPATPMPTTYRPSRLQRCANAM